jgi:hypothetical protein
MPPLTRGPGAVEKMPPLTRAARAFEEMPPLTRAEAAADRRLAPIEKCRR